ncbi:type I-E CRISPR-associated endoribonuclease Cas2e [Nicoliella lavandulae]|uniref:Type I-E CRISPR-associated endoribonuclease Cas2e n=1 Tax=Nicoliella lavandulae TaxID=3082954 RepID=A0ABU8SMI8_9LACO
MPMTVITLTKVTPALRGDLTKWMQEISTGVYVGNFNSRVRSKLWNRIIENIGNGSATISYEYRNEIGYDFDTFNTSREIINYEGIPLVRIPNLIENNKLKDGFSNASKFRKLKKINSKSTSLKYVILDIETTGINIEISKIIEIGAIKVNGKNIEKLNLLVNIDQKLPEKITNLTGISDDLLLKKGISLNDALLKLKQFIGNEILVGYFINFDLKFLHKAFKDTLRDHISNKYIDIMKLVERDNQFIENYKLESVLPEYGIDSKVPHRALMDAELINLLVDKLPSFHHVLKQKNH